MRTVSGGRGTLEAGTDGRLNVGKIADEHSAERDRIRPRASGADRIKRRQAEHRDSRDTREDPEAMMS